MNEVLFELSEQYEEMLMQGVSLSGEDPAFFMQHRVDDLRRNLPAGWVPRRILDFGCGTGSSAAYLSKVFPGSKVLGVDTSENALELATRRFNGEENIRFDVLDALSGERGFDLCYVSGVFHHIEPAERIDAVRRIFHSLAPGAHLAIFENNPWNPGARMVMSRIPFDRNAIMLPYREAETLLRYGGFELARSTRFLFYFPRPLALFRFIEPSLTGLPFGAQYYVLGRKPSAR